MGIKTRVMHVLLLGALTATPLALVGSSSAAPPAGPNYECATNLGGPSGPDPIKIMIAGDSITNASAGDYTWPYWLWQSQVGVNIDFVGRFTDTITANTLEQGSHAYLDCDFDQDHEARPGVKLWTDADNLDGGTYGLGQVAPANADPRVPSYDGYTSWIRGATDTYDPDILVIFAGANDLLRSGQESGVPAGENGVATYAIGKLNRVIDQARLGNPGVDVVLTTVPSTSNPNSRYNLYNSKLAAVVSSKNTTGERVVLANLPSWAAHSWDGLHPDAVGEVSIAAVIADRLHDLNPALKARPNPLPAPAIGPRFPAVLSAASAANNKVKLDWTLPPGADRTRIYVRNTNGGPWVLKADLVKSSLRDFYPNDGTDVCFVVCTTYTVPGLSGGTDYAFMVKLGKGHAVASAVASNTEVRTPTGPVTTVDQLSPIAGLHSLTARWANVAGVTSYDVRWRAAGSSTWKTTTAPSAQRVISGLIAGRAYALQVKPHQSSTWSNQVVGYPKSNVLAAGRKPVLTKLSGKRIKATWAASSGALKYQVQRRVKGGAWKVVGTTSSRKLVSGRLKTGKTYEFRIRPFDGDVGGPFSPTAKRKVS